MEDASFLVHYLDYLRSPAIILLLIIISAPFMLGLELKLLGQARPGPRHQYDCFRLGMIRKSNLPNPQKKAATTDTSTGPPRVRALFTYPVKSCRGIELAASEVGPTGLKYDRLFTFAQLISTSDGADEIKEGEASEVSTDWKHQWRFITQREFARLALLRTELWAPDPRKKAEWKAKMNGHSKEPKQRSRERKPSRQETTAEPSQSSDSGSITDEASSPWAENGGCLIIRFPFEPDFNPFGLRTEDVTIRVPLVPTSQRVKDKEYSLEPLSIWKDLASSINVTNEIREEDLAKLKHFIGVSNPLGLFRVDDRNRRAVTRSLPKDRPRETYSVGFGDAFPLHMLSLGSVHALREELPPDSRGAFDARRFRANIYLDGVEAYEEDRWKRILMGRCVQIASDGKKAFEADGEYHVACRTARCTLPNVDQETGLRDANEPYSTLSKTRKVDEGAYPHPCLGMQMIPLFPQGLLRVGDEIQVVETGEHYYEKMFS
jgi:uncharacterized protein YcbX